MMRFHLSFYFYVLLFTFYVLIALLGFSSISLAVPDTWTKRADMPTPRWNFSTSVVNGKIYAIGGMPSVAGGGLSTVEEYDPKTDTWTKKANMPTTRGNLSTSVVNGKIYAIGGSFGPYGSSPFSTVEEYDPMTDTWTKKTDMPTARGALSTSMVNGKIYAIGGTNSGGSQTFSTVEEYDPRTDTWTKKADMPTARYFLATSVVNERIYAVGGWIAAGRVTSTVEEYDPMTDTWTKKADMPTARDFLATSVVNGRIYAIGGAPAAVGLGVLAFSAVKIYDPMTDTWTKKADMPTARFSLSTSVVNGKIYAVGGIQNWPTPLSTVEEYDTGFTGDFYIYIHSVLPAFGDPKGGSSIRIQGGNFIPGSRVFIGGVESNNIKVESSALITAVIPSGKSGVVDIEVVRPDGQRAVLKNGFQYTILKVNKINPESAPVAGGIKVQVEGFGFQPGVEVQVGNKKLTDLFVTPFLIQGTLPPGTPDVLDVSVTNPNGERNVLPRAFTYVSPPAIKSISPIFVSVVGSSKEITIKGTGFISKPTVHIGSIPAQLVDFISSDELKIFTSPLSGNVGVGPIDVFVTNPDGQRAVLAKGVTVLAPIAIKSVEPTSGGLEGGTKITIAGESTVEFAGRKYPSRFVERVKVLIGNVEADDVTVQSDHVITAITPPNTPGPKDVDVINVDDQSDHLSNGFIYNPLPQIIKVIPNNGPLSGGIKITIQGSKFLPEAKVLIGDVDANSFIVAPSPEVASDAFITAITPKVPLDEPGLRDVVVVNPDGQEVVLRDGFTYNPLPTIRDLSPSYGPSSGGTKVIIRGTGFLQGARAIIGKRFATTEFKDDETIEAVTPANPKGRLDVRVVNPDTQEAVIPRAFISVGELAYNYPNPFQASRGTTFRYVPGPNESVESIVVRVFNLAGVPIGVVGAEGTNEVRWQDSRVNVGLYVYMMEVRVGGKVKRFKRALEVYK